MTDKLEPVAHEHWEEKRVKHLWFHVVREQVQSGEIARVGLAAWAVYCAIKSHTGLDTGTAFPSTSRLSKLVGVSHDTVQRALKKLVTCGLLDVRKSQGQSNSYFVTEKIKIEEMTGEPWATGERKYASTQFTQFVSELERLAKTGNIPTDKSITINLVIQNITQGDNGVVKGVDYSPGDPPGA